MKEPEVKDLRRFAERLERERGTSSQRGAAALGMSVEDYDRMIADSVEKAMPLLLKAFGVTGKRSGGT